jgi:hypothetical protein
VVSCNNKRRNYQQASPGYDPLGRLSATATRRNNDLGLGPVAAAFPDGVFPTGAIHEFISSSPEDTAASGGFIAGLVQNYCQRRGLFMDQLYAPHLPAGA